MRNTLALMRLNHELANWRRAWRTPLLWWRDDDCRTAGPGLERLLRVRGDIPLTLAVIPDGDLASLASRLGTATGVSLAQHGVDHENRLPAGGPRSEFTEDVTQSAVDAAVADGRARMEAAGLKPITFVPPWNEPSNRQIDAIRAAGYTSYSTGARGKPLVALAHIGAEVDILRWKGEPHFRGRWRVFNALRIQLELRRAAGAFDEPVGILTHHLVHDEDAWSFLDWFIGYARGRLEWRSLEAILASAR